MLSFTRLFAIALIFSCIAVSWNILGVALVNRTQDRGSSLDEAVDQLWGPPLRQIHPKVSYASPNSPGGKRWVQPAKSDVDVALEYTEKKKGLLWYRTFKVDFDAKYLIKNDTLVAQTFYFHFPLPANTSYADFTFNIGERSTDLEPEKDGMVIGAVQLAAGQETRVAITYKTQGRDLWEYRFDGAPKVEQFQLVMKTSFDEIDFPVGTASPTGARVRLNPGWELKWEYPKWLAPPGIGMAMPSVVNPGPVASRIAFFAPVSLIFFFTVLLMLAVLRSVRLHPMHFFFIGAACFAFQLIFAYTVDLMPVTLAFSIAAAVSLALNYCYLGAVAGWKFARLAAVAQFAYMVLFSYSFFVEGLTGITITIGAVSTLALLMLATARVSWESIFSKEARPRTQQTPEYAA